MAGTQNEDASALSIGITYIYKNEASERRMRISLYLSHKQYGHRLTAYTKTYARLGATIIILRKLVLSTDASINFDAQRLIFICGL